MYCCACDAAVLTCTHDTERVHDYDNSWKKAALGWGTRPKKQNAEMTMSHLAHGSSNNISVKKCISNRCGSKLTD